MKILKWYSIIMIILSGIVGFAEDDVLEYKCNYSKDHVIILSAGEKNSVPTEKLGINADDNINANKNITGNKNGISFNLLLT